MRSAAAYELGHTHDDSEREQRDDQATHVPEPGIGQGDRTCELDAEFPTGKPPVHRPDAQDRPADERSEGDQDGP